MENIRLRNDRLLAQAAEEGPKKQRLSKRAQKKLDKTMSNKNISDLEKQIILDEARGEGAAQSGSIKRQKLDTFKDKKNFITNTKDGGQNKDTKDRANESSLWDDHERAFLDDVTLNLIPDDEHNNTKGKTVMKWDKVKKRYMLQKVDREGKIMRERKNESGAKISKKNIMTKDPNEIYKKWQQRTHLTLQKSGEMENAKLVNQARNANESRHMMKTFKGRHADLEKGEDMRNP